MLQLALRQGNAPALTQAGLAINTAKAHFALLAATQKAIAEHHL